jgi:uracil-DNA glycosylase family 4
MTSESRDDARHLIADLKSYLLQRREAGEAWFLDAGPVAPAVRTGPATSSHAPPAPVSGAAPDPAGRPARQTARDDFESQCEAFVRETLGKIESNRQVVVVEQQDMFAAPVEAPPRLSRQEKDEALSLLAGEVAPCTRCRLHEGRTQTVFGVGEPDADLVFIGEAPGREEDLQGEPFVGRAGQLLNEILKAIGFGREEVYICNILKCRPPNNRDPEADEVECCEPYLKRQLAILEPRLICCLGRVAAQNLLGTRATLGSLRETVHFYEGIPVMATFHPAALLRNPHWKRPTWDDVRKLRALYDALRA